MGSGIALAIEINESTPRRDPQAAREMYGRVVLKTHPFVRTEITARINSHYFSRVRKILSNKALLLNSSISHSLGHQVTRRSSGSSAKAVPSFLASHF